MLKKNANYKSLLPAFRILEKGGTLKEALSILRKSKEEWDEETVDEDFVPLQLRPKTFNDALNDAKKRENVDSYIRELEIIRSLNFNHLDALHDNIEEIGNGPGQAFVPYKSIVEQLFDASQDMRDPENFHFDFRRKYNDAKGQKKFNIEPEAFNFKTRLESNDVDGWLEETNAIVLALRVKYDGKNIGRFEFLKDYYKHSIPVLQSEMDAFFKKVQIVTALGRGTDILDQQALELENNWNVMKAALSKDSLALEQALARADFAVEIILGLESLGVITVDPQKYLLASVERRNTKNIQSLIDAFDFEEGLIENLKELGLFES